MAKKKKSSKKASKTARRPAPRGAKAKPGGTKAAAAKPQRNPALVSTGRGPGPAEIGRDLVEMFNRGELKEIEEKWWSPADIVSIEGLGKAWRGRTAVEAKNTQWMAGHRIHGASAEGPFVGATGFAVKFNLDIEDTNAGKRELMEEVGVYTVRDGKIVQEEFMYGSSTPVSPSTPST
jgi:hypothetical protein